MPNIIPFAEFWHTRNPQGMSVEADRAWRYLNIMRSADFQKFAQALHVESPIASFFLSELPVGRVHSMEHGGAIGYMRSSVRDSVRILQGLKMIKLVGKDLQGSIIQMTPYGFAIRNSLRQGLFTKTG